VSSVVPNVWSFICATYDGSEMAVYVNDVLIDTIAHTGNVDITTDPVAIGNNPTSLGGGSRRQFDGLMDQITIWNKALDAQERTALFQQGLTTQAEAENGKLIEQSFVSPVTVDCQRIKLTVSRNATIPNNDLYVGISNIFGSTIAVSRLNAADVTQSSTDYTLTFDSPITLVQGNQYLIQIRSDSSNGGKYQIPLVSGDSYTDGVLRIDGTDFSAFDLAFTLLTTPIIENIFVDQLEVESESTFVTTGSFISRPINLGLVPDALDELRWVTTGTEDDIEIRIRVASSQAGLSSAPWSVFYTNPNGSDLGLLTPNQWIQYEAQWSGGGATDSTLLNSVTIEYSVTPGVGTAQVISTPEQTLAPPEKFIFVWEASVGSGAINFFISRDDKTTWQSVSQGQKGNVVDFTTATGSSINLRADITGNAKLFSWGVACDQEFI
jgi:hypothetical protein